MPTSETGCIVITGGASGIGAAVAEKFASSERAIVILDRRRDAAIIQAEKVGGHAIEVDISSASEVQQTVKNIEADIGVIEILVNCAGPLQNTDRPEELSMVVWDRMVDVHLRGTYLMTVEVGQRMAERRRGCIVSVASVMGMRSGPLHAYGPAKAGLINLNEGLAVEWGRRNVRVNTVSPGFVSTPGLSRGFAEHLLNEELLAKSCALGRLVSPVEVAETIYFLASDHASGITGCNIPVDGGYLAAASWGAYGGVRDN